MLAVASIRKYHIIQLDIKSAFLNGVIDEDAYVRPPPGICVAENHVVRLNKALYGLKQTARACNQMFEKCFNEINFIPSQDDKSLFISVENNTKIFILVYVDDIMIFGSELSKIKIVVNDIEP